MQQRNGSGYTRYDAPTRSPASTQAHRPPDGACGAGGTAPAKAGKSYDVVDVTVLEDGTKQYANRGLVFVRDSGSGGVAYLKLGGHGEHPRGPVVQG